MKRLKLSFWNPKEDFKRQIVSHCLKTFQTFFSGSLRGLGDWDPLRKMRGLRESKWHVGENEFLPPSWWWGLDKVTWWLAQPYSSTMGVKKTFRKSLMLYKKVYNQYCSRVLVKTRVKACNDMYMNLSNAFPKSNVTHSKALILPNYWGFQIF